MNTHPISIDDVAIEIDVVPTPFQDVDLCKCRIKVYASAWDAIEGRLCVKGKNPIQILFLSRHI